MNWYDDYRRKCCSIEHAVSLITSHQRVYVSGNAATPLRLLEGLAHRRDELTDVNIHHVMLWENDPLTQPGMEGHFRHHSLFVGPGDRDAVNDGRADYYPVFLYEIPRLFSSRLIPLDVTLMHVSPPDEHGFLSLGVECLATKAAAENSRIVIALVNDKMPRTLGDSFIHVSAVTQLVEISEELPQLFPPPSSRIEQEIGRHIAALVEDGSTLQLGIGGIPNAVLKALTERRHLGIHTEMVSDSIMEAMETGIITGVKKTLHPRKVVASFYMGSRELYRFIHNNPSFETHPADYTNHPAVISQNEKMVAINSAIEVDLTGQVCSDSIGSRIYSGFGGQVDFIRGAAQSRGGKPIIALTSTTKNGKISKIVSILKPGAGVVTTRADVHWVVTEYGAAFLHGKNLGQRAEALINIAHPDFRPQLEKEALARKLL
jgi:4-hydroxybutyrate CoA-transferase